MKFCICLVTAAVIWCTCMVFWGCTDPESNGCTVGVVQCSGDLVQVCDPKNTWETEYDCTAYGMRCCSEGNSFTCCENDAGMDGGSL